MSVTDYGTQRYISMVQKGNVMAAQFHPEKSGPAGLKILNAFLTHHGVVPTGTSIFPTLYSSTAPTSSGPLLSSSGEEAEAEAVPPSVGDEVTDVDALLDVTRFPRTELVRRVIACLDVRSNDAGDLVVTKGDQYDVREAGSGDAK